MRNKNLICGKVASCFSETYLLNLLILFRDSSLAKKFGSPFIRFGCFSNVTTKRSETPLKKYSTRYRRRSFDLKQKEEQRRLNQRPREQNVTTWRRYLPPRRREEREGGRRKFEKFSVDFSAYFRPVEGKLTIAAAVFRKQSVTYGVSNLASHFRENSDQLAWNQSFARHIMRSATRNPDLLLIARTSLSPPSFPESIVPYRKHTLKLTDSLSRKRTT